jgi:FAD:protein FMN transferase
MGTTYHVLVADQLDEGARQDIQRYIESALLELNTHLSTYNPESEISRLNANRSSGWVAISPMLYALLDTAQRVSRDTEGAFDVTIGPLAAAWGFGPQVRSSDPGIPDPVAVPTVVELQALMERTGHGLLELRAEPSLAVRKQNPALVLDVNGIAPGFAVDQIAAGLGNRGYRNVLVEIGGEVRALGRRADGRPWQIAVETPVAGERTAYAGIELSDRAVSTSGDYRDSRVTTDGQRIAHAIDPRSGRPVTHPLASVTVVHATAAEADAYATAFSVLGSEAGYALAAQRGLAVLFIDRTAAQGVWREAATPAFERLRRPGP